MNSEVLRYPEEAIREAARRFPTPFFLYEEARLRERCRLLRRSFEPLFFGFTPLFAVKANANPHVLKIIQEEGLGMDCSSDAEVWITNELGAGGMHTGNYTLAEELKLVLSSPKILLNLDDGALLKEVEQIGIPEFLSFRINPGFTKGSMASNELAGPNAKYGIPWEHAAEAYRQARDLGVRRFGIHAMTGSNVLDEEYFSQIAAKLWDIIIDLKRDLGIEFEYMNIGGGFGVPYRPEEKSLDMEAVARGIRKVFDEKSVLSGLAEPRLMVEPGRFITADAGFLVATVKVIKESYKKFVGIDASTNQMPRPAFYGAYHHISAVGKSEREKETVNVVGRICENNDQFALNRLLPQLEKGDILSIHNCGAHAFVMGHNYNGRLRPAEYLLREDGEIEKIREEETVADLYSHVLPW